MELNHHSAIGVFDSGVGGLTVVRALQKALPKERLLYVGDTARVPYGNKSPATVLQYARQLSNFLLARDIKYLVVACNTASAHALELLKPELPVPAIGVIQPGAQHAASRSPRGCIGVLATRGTVSSGAYQQAFRQIRPSARVCEIACPLLVPLAEEGWLDHPVTAQVAEHYLQQAFDQCPDLDTLVLGCTHYPLLTNILQQQADRMFSRPIELVDSAQAVADAVTDDLRQRSLLNSHRDRHRFYFTDTSNFAAVAQRFFGKSIISFEHADLQPLQAQSATIRQPQTIMSKFAIRLEQS